MSRTASASARDAATAASPAQQPPPSTTTTSPMGAVVGPHPSYIEVARPYIFEHKLRRCMVARAGAMGGGGGCEAREDSARLQGVGWIDNVRKALQLPVRTYNTACVYYHKFRLAHADTEYSMADAAAAALFTACKIEDTLKKSREILCAAFNLKLSPAEQLSPDDPLFEAHSKQIIGLERLMLEGASFDFRNRYPQKLVVKLCRAVLGLPSDDPAARTAYYMALDLYRTWAPLKQSTAAMALACVELALRLHAKDSETAGDGIAAARYDQLLRGVLDNDSTNGSDKRHDDHNDAGNDAMDVDTNGNGNGAHGPPLKPGLSYRAWAITRAEIMETLLDLLDLYTHHRSAALVGPAHPLDTYIVVRIPLNHEAARAALARHTNDPEPPLASPAAAQNDTSPNSAGGANGARPTTNGVHGTPRTPATPQDDIVPGRAHSLLSGASPLSGGGGSALAAAAGGQQQQQQRGQSGTVRFMLDAARAREERNMVERYFRAEEEEYEVEVEVEKVRRR